MKLSRISSGGKEAVTAYRVLQPGSTASLLECRTLTGRLHQVRVHLDAIGSPILGDELYAPPAIAKGAPRLALHAHRLVFKHPTSGQMIDITTPWPTDLRSLLKRHRLERPDLPTLGSAHRIESFHELQSDAVGEQEPLVGEDPTVR
jgi:hypothetical protein